MSEARPTPPPGTAVTVDDVRRAATVLEGVAHRTPVLTSTTLDDLTGATVVCKAEHLQRVGAFKFRGAYHALSSLPDDARSRGVVAFSSGNHAQAVALAAALHAVPATIVMPTDAPTVKVAATRGYGATVVTYDRYREDRQALGRAIAAESGATLVPPFDDPRVIAGQGTVALELLEQVAGLDVLVVPIGGGGLLAGCSVVARALRPDLEVVGVEPAGRRAARDALAQGRVVEVEVPRTVLDGQQTTTVGETNLPLLQAGVDRVVGVDDEDVLRTVALLATRTKQVVEPSGASALAAVLSRQLEVRGRRVGVVLSGGNITADVLGRAMATTAAA